uniref:Uncharacterized protein n=1 Tax=Myoviridae sp. ctkfK18 TaxID=2825165 RepID=A0A8S5VH57_9CAUD|nr:MAG TPA: hypothetical protein [Myoviridae sp. ctkfK18]
MNKEIKFVMIYRNMMQYDVVVESKTDNNIKTQRICEFVLKGKKDNKEVHIEILDKQYPTDEYVEKSEGVQMINNASFKSALVSILDSPKGNEPSLVVGFNYTNIAENMDYEKLLNMMYNKLYSQNNRAKNI